MNVQINLVQWLIYSTFKKNLNSEKNNIQQNPNIKAKKEHVGIKFKILCIPTLKSLMLEENLNHKMCDLYLFLVGHAVRHIFCIMALDHRKSCRYVLLYYFCSSSNIGYSIYLYLCFCCENRFIST